MKNVISHMESELARTDLPTPRITARRTETASQIIAQGIMNLTWKEAEKMGEGVKAKMKDGESLTSAIQAWAADWEKFNDV